jgi:hypothetical protein
MEGDDSQRGLDEEGRGYAEQRGPDQNGVVGLTFVIRFSDDGNRVAMAAEVARARRRDAFAHPRVGSPILGRWLACRFIDEPRRNQRIRSQ